MRLSITVEWEGTEPPGLVEELDRIAAAKAAGVQAVHANNSWTLVADAMVLDVKTKADVHSE